WPQILAERGASDPTQRRGLLLRAQAQRLARLRPDAPMIVAGSTGSIPATADLIAAIARAPRGAVVLPGLDMELDEESWRAIRGAGASGEEAAHTHPQAAMRRLIEDHVGISRKDVAEIG